MNRIHSFRKVLCIALVAVCLLSTSALADDEAGNATWIKDFVAQQDRWPRLVGATITIEGRFTGNSQASLRFRGCDLDFRLATGVQQPGGDSRCVKVRGRLARDGDDLYFNVTELDDMPTDMERLRAMRVDIDAADPDAWYGLAAWARERGEFYEDDDLRAESANLGRYGITTEYDHLALTDGAGLRALAEKVRGMGLSDTLRMEYVHESLRRDLAATGLQPQPNFAVVLGNVSRLLPGADLRLDADVRDQVIAAYESDPLVYYHDADESGRRRCHRAFYVDLTQRIILASAREDGSNGEAIAKRIRSDLPEFPELADEWELKFLDYEHSRVAMMSRAEVGGLSQRFRDRGDVPRSEQVWRDWLKARETILRPDGARGLMQLAGDYEELVHDEPQAAKLMLEAYALSPQTHEISDWLREHEYVFVDNQWVLATDVTNHPVTETERAIREGRVRPGMSPVDVRRALGGAPTSTIRIASSRRVTELWVYEEHRISVRFVHNPNRESAMVDEVLPLRASP